MYKSIWRLSHFILALLSSFFLIFASLTGAVLAINAGSKQLHDAHPSELNGISLAESVTAFKAKYTEIVELNVDQDGFFCASVFDENGDFLEGYFNPKTAQFIEAKEKNSAFINLVTNFHRSLFLKSTGRLIVGLCSFFLCLITISGILLLIKRQGSLKMAFKPLVKNNFYSDKHIYFARLSLIPILIIALSGVYLSLLRFDLIQERFQDVSLTENTKSYNNTENLSVFKQVNLDELDRLEFPFSPDESDYYLLKLKDRELEVNQYSGEIASASLGNWVQVLGRDIGLLHTGKQASILYNLMLFTTCLFLMFFIYTGFKISLNRRPKIKKAKATIAVSPSSAIIYGSESGSTERFARLFQKQLLAQGEDCSLIELNDFENSESLDTLYIFTATYGQGEAPENADEFLENFDSKNFREDQKYAVLGFGSRSYPEFCKFAKDIDQKMLSSPCQELLTTSYIDNFSIQEILNWVKEFNSAKNYSCEFKQSELRLPSRLKTFKLLETTKREIGEDGLFNLLIKPPITSSYQSGDLLSIELKEGQERLYSIAKIKEGLLLSIKKHNGGLGSEFLYNLDADKKFKARIIRNDHFYLPKNSNPLILIANGTGVAPFIGMIEQAKKTRDLTLYFGIANREVFSKMTTRLDKEKVNNLHLAFSREEPFKYVQDLIFQNSEDLADKIKVGAEIMICGSLAMEQEVILALDAILKTQLNSNFSEFKKNGRYYSDCY
jgi:sulfite reductase (NADPH) flavoprotein alpha-component